jgi:cytochrome c peroxidase
MPESSELNKLPNQDKKNPITPAKVELGKLLFFETGLALEPKYNVSTGTYSCSSCHIPSKGFTAGRFQGIADGGLGFGLGGESRKINRLYTGKEVDAQGARPLPTINLTYVTNALWAGSFGSFGVNTGTSSVWKQDTLIEINFKGLEGLEANNQRALIVHRQVVNKQVTDKLGYTSLFNDAFPEIPVSTRYTRETAGMAIAAYQRTILTNRAPFQRWLKGEDDAMSEVQKKGAVLFFGKAGCVNCHKSPSFNSMEFQAIGTNHLYQSGFDVFRTDAADRRNLGRGGFTYEEKDMFKFKVPQLYNLKEVGFYFHGASKRSIREVVEYFNKGVPENPGVPASQISSRFRPLQLSGQEISDLTEFLENALLDPDLERYVPGRILSGNCFPDNDYVSKVDLNCK